MNNCLKLEVVITKYINLQSQNFLDEREQKVYTDSDISIFKKCCEYDMRFFSDLVDSAEYSQEKTLEPRIYSRTKFFSKCFYELTKSMKLEDIEQEIDRIKLAYDDDENSKMAIDKLAEKTIEIKKFQARRNETYKNIEKRMNEMKVKVLRH